MVPLLINQLDMALVGFLVYSHVGYMQSLLCQEAIVLPPYNICDLSLGNKNVQVMHWEARTLYCSYVPTDDRIHGCGLLGW